MIGLIAQVAQLVEHTLGKGEVGSSNLLLGSRVTNLRVKARNLIIEVIFQTWVGEI